MTFDRRSVGPTAATGFCRGRSARPFYPVRGRGRTEDIRYSSVTMMTVRPGTVGTVYETSEQMAGPITRAAQYLRGSGDRFALARVGALIGAAGTQIKGLADLDAAIAAETAAAQERPAPPKPQNQDGGWAAPWSAGASSLDATCFLLDQLSDFGVPVHTVAGVDFGAALGFLTAAQLPDGSWSEGLGDLTPRWLMPGSAEAKVYLTANCARTLLVYGSGKEQVEQAAELLEYQLSPHGRLPGPAASQWLAARVFRATGRDLAARRILDVVGHFYEGYDATELAWFGSDTPPGDRWTQRVAAHLVTLQQPDGSWIGEADGPSPALTATAVRVLLRA